MRASSLIRGAVVLLAGPSIAASADATGDPDAGARVFRACAACHSLQPGEHRTGPSLAGLWGREAGTADGFTRYSPTLKSADVTWNAETLDPWLADPQAFIPNNRMTFPGIEDDQARADLIAFLEEATAEGAAPQTTQRGGMMGGGMMGAPQLPDLEAIGPEQQVAAIRYCGDTYRVTTAAGETLPFWEFNLRFKTDSSGKGPPKGKPVLLPAGMMGDRASVVFAAPAEISNFIRSECESGGPSRSPAQ